jgi:hypothetical protein
VKTNEDAYISVREVTYAVSMAVYRAADAAVDYAARDTVRWRVHRAVARIVCDESPHPALRDFLSDANGGAP